MNLKDMFRDEPAEEVTAQEPVKEQPTPTTGRVAPAPRREASIPNRQTETAQALQQAKNTLQRDREVIAMQGRRISQLEQRQAPRRQAPTRQAPRAQPRPAPTLKPSAKIGRPSNGPTSVRGSMPRAGSYMGGGVPSSMPRNNKKSRRK